MLEYKIRQTREVTILDLSGRISVGEALAFGPGSGTVLSDVIRDLASKGHRKILLNLKDVKYIDSSGIASLVEVLREARNSEKRLVLFGVTGAVLQVLQLTRLTGVFEICETEEQALNA